MGETELTRDQWSEMWSWSEPQRVDIESTPSTFCSLNRSVWFSRRSLYASSRELSAVMGRVEGLVTGPLVLAALAASLPFRVYRCSLSASHFVAAGPPISLMLRDNCAGGEDGGCRVGERLSYKYGDSWEP